MKTLIACLIFAAGAASAQDVVRGGEAFQTHCATCHGGLADGTGSMAVVMTVPPSDLTQLSEILEQREYEDTGGSRRRAQVHRRTD